MSEQKKNKNKYNKETRKEKPSFNDLMFELNNLKKYKNSPKVDLLEEELQNNNCYIVRIELPGVKKQNINIRIQDSQFLLVSALKYSAKTRTENIIYNECSYNNITRRVKLPELVRDDNIIKSYKDGVLEIVLEQTSNKKYNQKTEYTKEILCSNTETISCLNENIDSRLKKSEDTSQFQHDLNEIKKTINFNCSWSDYPVD